MSESLGGFRSAVGSAVDSDHGDRVELKVGTRDNQHIVAVGPDGKGSSFSLVYVRTHGKDADVEDLFES